GPFRLADAVAPDGVTAYALRDPAELVRDLPARELDDAGRAAVVHGRPVPVGDGTRESGNVALFWSGHLVAVAERVGEVLKPRVVVVEPWRGRGGAPSRPSGRSRGCTAAPRP